MGVIFFGGKNLISRQIVTFFIKIRIYFSNFFWDVIQEMLEYHTLDFQHLKAKLKDVFWKQMRKSRWYVVCVVYGSNVNICSDLIQIFHLLEEFLSGSGPDGPQRDALEAIFKRTTKVYHYVRKQSLSKFIQFRSAPHETENPKLECEVSAVRFLISSYEIPRAFRILLMSFAAIT